MSWESEGVPMLMSQDGGYDGIRVKTSTVHDEYCSWSVYSQISRHHFFCKQSLPICFLKSTILLQHSAVLHLTTLKSLTWKWIHVWFKKNVLFQDVKSEVRVIAVEVKAFVMTMVPAFVMSGQAHWCWQQDKLLWMILRGQMGIPLRDNHCKNTSKYDYSCPNAVVNIDQPPSKKARELSEHLWWFINPLFKTWTDLECHSWELTCDILSTASRKRLDKSCLIHDALPGYRELHVLRAHLINLQRRGASRLSWGFFSEFGVCRFHKLSCYELFLFVLIGSDQIWMAFLVYCNVVYLCQGVIK